MVVLDDGDVAGNASIHLDFGMSVNQYEKIVTLKWSGTIKMYSCPGSRWPVPWT